MEKLIFIAVIVILSLLHSWWKKKQEAEEDESNPWPGYPPRHKPNIPPANRPAAPPPQPKAASWEEELRRLLEGDQPKGSTPPPVVVQPVPPPLPRAAASRPVPAPRPILVEQSDPDMDKGFSAPSLEHSAQAFLRTSQLESKVAAHMQRADHQVTPKPALKRDISPVARQAVALVRDRQSQRAAIIAGIILGPPKAMEG